MGHPFKTSYMEITGEQRLRAVVDVLICRSAWFEVTPLLNDRWALEVKPENCVIPFQLGFRDVAITDINSCAGCS